jgi:hypothetical protein
LETNEAYADLKALLLRKGCKVVAEEPPKFISVKQGSLWGISPRTAKKVVSYRLSPVDSGTRISWSSSLASDWKNLTIIGSALAVLVMALCWWITADLEAFMIMQEPTYWSWIVMVDSYIDFQMGQMFVGLTRMLAVFLAIIIALEAVIAVYAHFRINAFAEENLRALS